MHTARLRRKPIVALAVLSVALGWTASGGSPAAADGCAAPVASQTQPGVSIADPNCDFGTNVPFVALTSGGSPISTVYTGISNGSAYRIEKPTSWNGKLVVYAHGFRGFGSVVWVESPNLRSYFVNHGFAWAASSFQKNGPSSGFVADTHDLLALFTSVTGTAASAVYANGRSAGGLVTVSMIEQYPGDFVGAMPYCGIVGGTSLFSYYLDAVVTAAALTGTTLQFPTTLNDAAAYTPTYDQQVHNDMLPLLGSNFLTPNVSFTALGRTWQAAVEQRSGGTRPGMDSAFAFWNATSFPPLTDVPLLFGQYPGISAGTFGIATGNITDNANTVYQLDGNPALSAAEQTLNANVLRVSANATADAPVANGTPGIPVVSLHDIGDLFVPFSTEQMYASKVAAHGQSNLLATRAIRGNAHCGFTNAELEDAFGDLVKWVEQDDPAGGDDILDPAKVADSRFGCHFTDGSHPEWGGGSC